MTLLKSLEVFVLLLSGKAAVSTLQMHNGIAQGEWFSKMGVDFWHRVIQIPLEILHFCQWNQKQPSKFALKCLILKLDNVALKWHAENQNWTKIVDSVNQNAH